MDCIFHGVAKNWKWLSDLHFHFSKVINFPLSTTFMASDTFWSFVFSFSISSKYLKFLSRFLVWPMYYLEVVYLISIYILLFQLSFSYWFLVLYIFWVPTTTPLSVTLQTFSLPLTFYGIYEWFHFNWLILV